jgi:hypothetical protein
MSDKPKHTPGPWEWCETKTGLYGPDYPIIDTDRDWGMFLHPTNLEANARLISAAPELLEALEESRDFIVDHCEDMSRIYSKWELIDKIKSAIAKAKP